MSGAGLLSVVHRGLRRPETLDLARRLLVIPADRIRLTNHPVGMPAAAFNPALLAIDGELIVYPRVVLGYYKYVSSVAELHVPLSEALEGRLREVYEAKIVVAPSNRYDLWGAEDPRITQCRGGYCMVYTGRTLNYFDPKARHEKTLPVMAFSPDLAQWSKQAVFVPHPSIREWLISDKDAYIFETGGGTLFFHRPHVSGEGFHTLISSVDAKMLGRSGGGTDPVEVEVGEPLLAVEKERFEDKIGWSTPPVEVEPNRYLVFLHAVGRRMKVYRVFALLLHISGSDVEAEAVSPAYVMEPREIHETYGDRPYVVFPCGAALVDDQLLISYGGADSVVALASFEASSLVHLVDKGRLA